MLKHRFYDYLSTDRYLLVVEFEDPQVDRPLSEFIMYDAAAFTDELKAELDKVLSGESDGSDISWNDFYTEIRPDVTKVSCDLLNDDYIEESCEVNTRDLRELVEEWRREKKKFLARHPNDHL